MPKLSADRVCELLRPYLDQDIPRPFCEKVQRYAALLELWNKKLNLTSVRDSEQMIERHFGESFFMARLLPAFDTLLDVGSGAGFPGLPISMLYPSAEVTLAESQVRKAIFLREAAWMIGSQAKIWAQRIEDMELTEQFNVVVLRSVDNMQEALQLAAQRVAPGGTLAYFLGETGGINLPLGNWQDVDTYDVPKSTGRIAVVRLGARRPVRADVTQTPKVPPAVPGIRYSRIS